MFTVSRPNSRARARVGLMLAFALTAGLLGFPSAASHKPASSGSGMLVGAANNSGQALSTHPPEPFAAVEARAQDAYGKLGLQFEANRGQTDEQVKFLARGAGYTLFLTSTEAVLALRNSDCGLRNNSAASTPAQFDNPRSLSEQQSANCNPQSAVLRMKVEGANPTPDALGMDKLPGIVNYFIGSDSSKWRADIPTFGRVHFGEV